MISKLNMSPGSKEIWFNQALARSNRQRTCSVPAQRKKTNQLDLPIASSDPSIDQRLIYSVIDNAASTEWIKGRSAPKNKFFADPRNHTAMTRFYRKKFEDSRFLHEKNREMKAGGDAPAVIVSSLSSMDKKPVSLSLTEEETLDRLRKTCKKSIYTTRKQNAIVIPTAQDGRPLREQLSYEERMALREQASLGSRKWIGAKYDTSLQLQASFSTAGISPSMEQLNSIKDGLKASPSMQIFGKPPPVAVLRGTNIG